MPTTPERRARLALLIAAVGSAVGVAIAGSLSQTIGGTLVVAGWATFLYALHSFGRSGDA